jgi:putative hydrolase of the HAD superfamily
MGVRAVIFDLFDTVVDLHMEALPESKVGGQVVRGTQGRLLDVLSARANVDLETLGRVLRDVDREHRVPLYEEGREFPTLDRFQHVADRLGVSDPEVPELLTAAHMDSIVETARYLPHHVEVLRDLREHARIGICSNFSHTATGLRVLEASGLAPHLDAVVISEEVGIRKPRREIFEATLERLGVAASDAIHVGDRLDADVRGAGELGMTPVWITRRVTDPDEKLRQHTGPKPAHVIADLAELRAIVGAG